MVAGGGSLVVKTWTKLDATIVGIQQFNRKLTKAPKGGCDPLKGDLIEGVDSQQSWDCLEFKISQVGLDWKERLARRLSLMQSLHQAPRQDTLVRGDLPQARLLVDNG